MKQVKTRKEMIEYIKKASEFYKDVDFGGYSDQQIRVVYREIKKGRTGVTEK